MCDIGDKGLMPYVSEQEPPAPWQSVNGHCRQCIHEKDGERRQHGEGRTGVLSDHVRMKLQWRSLIARHGRPVPNASPTHTTSDASPGVGMAEHKVATKDAVSATSSHSPSSRLR